MTTPSQLLSDFGNARRRLPHPSLVSGRAPELSRPEARHPAQRSAAKPHSGAGAPDGEMDQRLAAEESPWRPSFTPGS